MNKRGTKINKKETNKRDKNVTLRIMLINTNNGKSYSSLIIVPSVKTFKTREQDIKLQAIQSICNRENKTGKELIEEGFKEVRVRIVTE